MAGHVSLCAASLSRFMTIVPLPMASSMSNRLVPGIQPSCWASFHEAPFFRTPMMTFKPLSRRLRPCPCPCEPYPMSASVSFLKYSYSRSQPQRSVEPQSNRVEGFMLTKSFSRGQSSRSVQGQLPGPPSRSRIRVPYTVSLCPAKSIVFTPRFCCSETLTVRLHVERLPICELLAAAMKVRRWIVGEAN